MKKQHYIALVTLLVIAGVYGILKRKASSVEQSKVVEPTAGGTFGHLDYVLSETNGTSTVLIDGAEIQIHRSDYDTESKYQQAIELAILNYEAINLHNDCIAGAISTATNIEIRSVRPVGGELIRKVELTDQVKIKWLLEKFELPSLIKTTAPSTHKCGGHIKFTILCSSNEKYHMGYDHGSIMKPIMHWDLAYRHEGRIPFLMLTPGSMKFKDGVTNELNQFLKDLGFSEEEIGIYE